MTSMVFHGHRTHYAFSIRDNTATILYANQSGDYRNINKSVMYNDIILRIADDGGVEAIVKNRFGRDLADELLNHLFTEKELTVMRLGAIPVSVKLIVDKHL